MENLFALNRAGSHLTPDTYRDLEIMQVMEMFDLVDEMIRLQQKEYEKNKRQ